MRTKSRRWIGVDGEGVGRKPHRYVLLACSDGDYVERRSGLSTVDCLDFLLDLGTRDARVCGYYLGYDWTKILSDLDNHAIYALYRPELRLRPGGSFTRVVYKKRRREFRLHWLAGAMWLADDRRKVTIWDLGKYYQGPFVNALKDWTIRPDVQEEIAAMKKRRALFTWREISRIRRYCIHECEALADFGGKLEQAHTKADLTPRGWYGPGSTASVVLKRHDIHERRGILPPPLVEPVAIAFIGGRAEISLTGTIDGPIHGFDISSAYPDQISRLPCLEHGRWERVTKERAITGPRVAHALIYGHVRNAPGAWAPLPVRLPNARIVFPRGGARGWWWRDEWTVARSGWSGLEFDHAYVLRRECDCKPFAFMPELFARRRAVDKDSGEGKVLKLAMNSCYGKLAQTIGSAQYASRAWAGMITSGTRAQVLRLMLRHKQLDHVLMVATDGLFSRERVQGPDIVEASDKDKIVLGEWEHSEHESITLIRPGIYWLGEKKLRARGLGRENLGDGKATMLAALAAGVAKVRLADRTVFGGAKQHVRAHLETGELSRSPAYGQWHGVPTNVSLSPDPKRAPDWQPPTLDDVESAPYGTRSTRAAGAEFELLEAIREYFY